MDRLNDSLQREITLLKNDMQDFKSRQYSGVGNVVSYQTETNDVWDVDWTAVYTPPYAQLGVTIEFTADTYSGSFVGFEMYAEVNGQPYWDFDHDVEIRQLSYGQNEVDFALAKRKTKMELAVLTETHGTKVKLKFKVNSIDTGTLEVTSQVYGV